MKTHVLSALIGLAATLATLTASGAEPGPKTLRVAAVQMRSEQNLPANIAKITQQLAALATRGVQVAAFPECAASGYSREGVNACSAADLAAAEKEIAAACREHAIAAIVGIPQRHDGHLFNSLIAIDAQGATLARYDKAYPTDEEKRWSCVAGSSLPPVFPLGGVPVSVQICHDSRFPELTRLPVLCGARVIFYISHEASLGSENKIGPYRAQVQARAVENTVYVVHANAPANDVRSGSHGQSRIVSPTGAILQEASMLQEEVLVADLDLAESTGHFAMETLKGPFADWYREAMKRVPVVK
jgi:predicted amidohydrolase